MIIRLKTNNLRIGKREHIGEIVKIPLNIDLPSDRMIAKMHYVFEKDFHGVKKNKSLIFYYITGYGRKLKELHIPINDNL